MDLFQFYFDFCCSRIQGQDMRDRLSKLKPIKVPKRIIGKLKKKIYLHYFALFVTKSLIFMIRSKLNLLKFLRAD